MPVNNSTHREADDWADMEARGLFCAHLDSPDGLIAAIASALRAARRTGAEAMRARIADGIEGDAWGCLANKGNPFSTEVFGPLLKCIADGIRNLPIPPAP